MKDKQQSKLREQVTQVQGQVDIQNNLLEESRGQISDANAKVTESEKEIALYSVDLEVPLGEKRAEL